MCIGMLIGVVLLASAALAGGETEAERIARLIGLLGHDKFSQRESASKELEALGTPALEPLHQAMASTQDAEVYRRADQIIQNITASLRAAVAKKELARWEGEWVGNGQQKFLIKGDRWAWGEAGPWQLEDSNKNRIEIIDVGEKLTQANLIVVDAAGSTKVCKAIFRLDGDTLHYCGTYDLPRPTAFVMGQGNPFYVAWKRVKK
jgi:hypothetical protein